MSDVNLGPVAGIALYALFRALRDAGTSRTLASAPVPPRRAIVTPPPGRSSPVSPVASVPDSRATLQLAWPIPKEANDLTVPVQRWEKQQELLGWRFWGLGRHPKDGGVRLRSFRAPYAWDGPVLRAHRLPSESPFSRAGVYALKSPKLCNVDLYWESDECWVSGWVALSGRVVEHERGYRAERAVIRRLRLGVAAHLHLPKMEDVMAVAAELERRYQAPVDLGQLERRYALSLLEQHPGRWDSGIAELAAGTRV